MIKSILKIDGWFKTLPRRKIRNLFLKKNFIFKFGYRNIERFLYFKRMFDITENVEGDIVECGIGRTKTFQMLAILLKLSGKQRRLWGFDSFQGFPEVDVKDINPLSSGNPKKGNWNIVKEEDVFRALKEIRLDNEFISSKIRLVKGFFEDTLPQSEVSRISILHLDVDLYNSYKTCLTYLFPKLSEGGVVMFDEYINEERVWPGARKAIDEFFNDKGYRIQKDPFGKYFVTKKK